MGKKTLYQMLTQKAIQYSEALSMSRYGNREKKIFSDAVDSVNYIQKILKRDVVLPHLDDFSNSASGRVYGWLAGSLKNIDMADQIIKVGYFAEVLTPTEVAEALENAKIEYEEMLAWELAEALNNARIKYEEEIAWTAVETEANVRAEYESIIMNLEKTLAETTEKEIAAESDNVEKLKRKLATVGKELCVTKLECDENMDELNAMDTELKMVRAELEHNEAELESIRIELERTKTKLNEAININQNAISLLEKTLTELTTKYIGK